jgi:catechol 2,3-dioxygenase-like lactoylglutathione lyase family enzyme
MRIALSSVFVDDQEKALRFYTDVLGFVKKHDIPMGEFRWLTVVSPEGTGDVELVLEPNAHPATKDFQARIFADGIPATSFASADIHPECDRLKGRGVQFRSGPEQAGPVWIAVFEDTCGNLIQLHQA